MNKLSNIALFLLAVAAVSSCSETVDLRPFGNEKLPKKILIDPDGGNSYFGISLFEDWSCTGATQFTAYPSSGKAGVESNIYVSAPENKFINAYWYWDCDLTKSKTTRIEQSSAYHANFTNSGGTKTFVVRKPESSWQITGIPSWLTVSPSSGSSSTANCDVTITAKQNLTGSARYCTLRFNNDNFYVYQGPDNISITESSTGNSYFFLFQDGKKGQSKTLTITSTADWTLEASSLSSSWLGVSTASGKAGKTSLTLSLLKDPYSENAEIYFKIGGAVMKRIAIIAE